MTELTTPEPRIDVCRRILDDFQAEEIDGVLIDVQTANAMSLVWEHLSEKSRASFESLDVARVAAFCWSQVTGA